MSHAKKSILLALLWTATVLFGAPGCAERVNPDDPMLPDVLTAKKAIEATMVAWKAGRPTGNIEEGSPRIQVADSFRVPGQMLERHEILGETKSEKSRDMTVKVIFSNPAETQIIRYRVIGIDPVLVIREEDYQLIAHWDHKMTEESAPSDQPPIPTTK